MLAWLLIVAVMGILWGIPDTTLARILRCWLVEVPARALDQVRTGKLFFYAVLAIGGLVLSLLFEMEGLRLFGMLLPDTLVWFAMFDVGVFIDALLIGAAVLASNGLRTLRKQVETIRHSLVTRVVRRSARGPRRHRRLPPRRTSTKDDRPAWPAQPGYRAFSIA